MDSSYITNPLDFLVRVIFDAYILVVLLRFLLQLFHADFYNPLSQFIVKITSPVLIPMRRVIPSVAGVDTASLVLAWLLKSIELILILLLNKGQLLLLTAFLFAIPELLELTINVFLVVIFVQVILSWISQGYNPAGNIIQTLADPILRPVSRYVKPVGGLDLTPMIAILGLILLKMLLLPPIKALVATILGAF